MTNTFGDDDDDLTGEERARAHLEAGLPAYGESYGSGFHGQLQRAIWGDSDEALLYDADAAAKRLALRRHRLNYITSDQFFEVYDAVCFANSQGWIMNGELTINFRDLGLTDDKEIRSAFQIWTARLRDWYLHRELPAAYVYSWERQPTNGLHLHALLYYPAGRRDEFTDWVGKSIRSLAKPTATWSHLQPKFYARPKLSVPGQWGWFRYLVKGLDPHASLRDNNPKRISVAEQARLDVERQGEVPGKRCGASRSLSWKARKAAMATNSFVPTKLDGMSGAKDFWTAFHFVNRRTEPVKSVGALDRLF